ncbi:hypothetical protein [Borrelia sp. P9F1]|uniref:hypothetical protein n=1 Tax=Borrelia sp. P9F1 TaxID=3058374 RepID=UPI002647E768|nr:hypothetical protein [Borrelia sp. P9F1]WKC58517.1 hypothetical protein QYZ68_04680 [Borrelia sp. P9F1]
MRFRLKYLALRAWVRKDKFWKIYTSQEIQEKKQDASITNFPVLTIQDMNWGYIYEYVVEWVEKKYKERGDIVIKKQDEEYLCETKSCFRFNKILVNIYKDFKEIFLSRLKKKVEPVLDPVQAADQQGKGAAAQVAEPQQQARVDASARKIRKDAPDVAAKAAVQPDPALKKNRKEAHG